MSDLYDPNQSEPNSPAPEGGSGGDRSGTPGPPAGQPEPHALPAGPPEPAPQPVPDSVQNSEPERIPSGGSDSERIRIGLWGAPRSGKTTFLAALPIAAIQHQRHHEGGWHISGMTQEANSFLSQGMDLLTRERKFPEATTGVREMSWSVQGPPEKGRLGLRSRRPNFVLDIQDAAGEVFGRDHPQQAQLVAQLARSHGLIYLFDPLGDGEHATESFNYLQSTLTQLTSKVRERDALVDGKLPHHVSVCIAKFDHPDVFKPAIEEGWITQDTEGAELPRVPEEQGEKFFQWMCDDFCGANAQLVRDALHAHFDRRRISYYATSAVGFRLHPRHVFDYKDYVQSVEVDGKPRIRTSPVPINVLEPLIDLERRIHKDRSRGGGRDRRGGGRGGRRR